MKLIVNTVKPLIKINTVNAKVTMEQPKGELSITTTPAKMEKKQELPKVKIDQYQCFAEAGLKNYKDLSKEFAQLGYKKVMEGISRRVSEGNSTANIENGNFNVIAKIASQVMRGKVKEFNYDIIPKSRPKITVEGSLDIKWHIGETNIDYTPHKPIINYQPGKVEIYLDEKPSIDIRFVDEKV